MKTAKNTTPLRTALIYAFFGVIWILISDITVDFSNSTVPVSYHIMQSIKGSLFVFVKRQPDLPHPAAGYEVPAEE